MSQQADESGKMNGKKKETAVKIQYQIDESGGQPNLFFQTQFNVPGNYNFTPNTPGCFLNKLPPADQKVITDGIHQSWNILRNTPIVIPNVSQVPVLLPNFQAATFAPPNFPRHNTSFNLGIPQTAASGYFQRAPFPRLQFLRAPAADWPLPPVPDEHLGFETPVDMPTLQANANPTFQQVPTTNMTFQQAQAAGLNPVPVPPPNPIFARNILRGVVIGVLEEPYPVLETRQYAVPPQAHPQSGNQNPL